MKHCIFYIFIFFVFQSSAIGQEAINVFGEISDSYGALEKVVIKIKKDSYVIDTYKSNQKGAFYFELNYGFEYLVSFSKKGYASKSVIVNTKLPEKIPPDINQVIKLKLELIEKLSENTQKSEPLGEIFFNRITKEFSYESKHDENSFTNIEVAGVDYYLAERKKLGLPVDDTEQKEDKKKFPFNEAYYKKRKLEFFEKIKNRRSKLIGYNSALYKKENKEKNLIKKMPLDTAISRYTIYNIDIVEVIINNEKILRVYHRVKHDWGETFYFKNYRAISKTLFYLETNLKKKRLKRNTNVHSTTSLSN